MPARRAEVTGAELLTRVPRSRAEQGARLVALWGTDDRDRDRGYCAARRAASTPTASRCSSIALPDDERPRIRTSRAIFPAANRMQRAAFDLVGVASDADDQRPWLWHASWPIDRFPLRRDFVALAEVGSRGQEDYPFVRVEGDGVHEIPVGPVHAGIIEPGHFRFQVVGEKVLRLEERLGYVHKGIEKRFESMSHRRRRIGSPAASPATAPSRTRGRTRRRVEAIAAACRPAARAWLRALALERERIANHLGDLGYLGNDGGFAFGLAQFSRLKEDVLRTNLAAFGHRLAMDYIVPGGVARDVDADACGAIARRMRRCSKREIRTLRDIYDEHAGLQDRFRDCGLVTPELASQLGLTGLAGRASGQAFDLRCDFPAAPYDALARAQGHRTTTATSPRASPCASTRSSNRCGSIARDRRDCRRRPDGDVRLPLPRVPRASHRPGLRRRLARSGAASRSKAARTARSAAAIRTIRRGRTGRCSSTR